MALGVGNIFSQETNIDLWGSTTNDFQMSISVKNGKSDVLLGSPIILMARLQNLSSTKTIQIHEFNQKLIDGSYSFSVISPSGSDISPKINVNGPLGGSGGTYAIGPGQIHEAALDLSLVCKFEAVGTYKVIVTKQVEDLSDSKPSMPPFILISNPLYIKVVQQN